MSTWSWLIGFYIVIMPTDPACLFDVMGKCERCRNIVVTHYDVVVTITALDFVEVGRMVLAYSPSSEIWRL